jgi:hypothetical protein
MVTLAVNQKVSVSVTTIPVLFWCRPI